MLKRIIIIKKKIYKHYIPIPENKFPITPYSMKYGYLGF